MKWFRYFFVKREFIEIRFNNDKIMVMPPQLACRELLGCGKYDTAHIEAESIWMTQRQFDAETREIIRG